MNSWPVTKIRDVSIGVFDGPHATPPPAEDGPVFLGIGNVTEDGHLDLTSVRHIAEEDYGHWTKRVVPSPGDVVFTYEATLNRYAIIPEGFRGCLGRRMALIRPNPEKVDTRFLFYSMFSPEWRRTIEANRLTGATVDRIPIKKFPDFPIRLPPMETQRRMAAILGAYDDLIDVNRRRVALLEEMARGLFEEWFVRFRFPGYEGVPIVDTPEGMLPVGWEFAPLNDFLVLQRGFDLPKSTRMEGEVPVFSASGYHGRHNEHRVVSPGVATGRSGTIGQVHLVWDDFWPLNTTLYVREFRRAGPVFAFLLLQRLDLAKRASGSAVPTLNRNHIHGIRLPAPPAALAVKFEEIVSPMYRAVRNLEETNNTLAASRDLLLPRLISGQLPVEAAERELEAAA